MAGNYPDVTSWRMAWDVDGAQCFFTSGSNNWEIAQSWQAIHSQASPEDMVAMNSEVRYGGNAGIHGVVIIFPELRDLDGIMLSDSTTSFRVTGSLVQVSQDTTNGIDGTWTTLTSSIPKGNTPAEFRTNIFWSTALNIKGVRWGTNGVGGAGGGATNTVHLYGEPAPGENLQRLEIWHPTLNQRLGPADLDWGDVPRNSTETREFRVKNMSPSLTATDIRVAMSILTDTTPSVVGQMALSSNDGASWAAQLNLGNLAPGAISPTCLIRRTTAANATLSLWWHRLFADSTSWT